MAKLSFDYSRFDNIVDSDDEKDHHPNLDRGLNQRVVRITRERKEDEIDSEKKKLQEVGKYDEAEKLETRRPLHVGNMCKVAEERTIINSTDGSKKDRKVTNGEEFSIDDYSGFKDDNEQLLKEFVEADWEKSGAMLKQHGGDLLDDSADAYFMLTALEEEMAGNSKQVDKLVRQGQIISQIRQLAQTMKRPPRDLVHRFFDRFQEAEGKSAFQEGVDNFYKHIKTRAVQKKAEQEKEAEEAGLNTTSTAMDQDSAAAQGAVAMVDMMYKMPAQMRKNMAPKGIDPVGVYEKLPEELKAAFKSSSKKLLEEAHQKLDPAVFAHHFQLCIDSGLWEEELNAFVHISTG